MSKAHRGTGVRTEPNRGRGTCVRCGKESIKALYEVEFDGKKGKVCKFCNASLKNIARKNARAAKSVSTENA